MRIVYNEGKVFVSFDKEQMDNIKKTWPQPVEISKSWVPLLINDIAEVNLLIWRNDSQKKSK